jgi:DNA helicase-2/ATP-dependent DNA helicase PcrA
MTSTTHRLGLAHDDAHREGLEYDAVFVTGVEEDLIPHRISAGEPGGPQEERRLFYVALTRAQEAAPLARDDPRPVRRGVGAMPSRFLQEIPHELIDWRQSPGDVNSRGGTQSRALNARPGAAGGFGGSGRVALRRRPRAAAATREAGGRPHEVRQPHPREGPRQRRSRARARRPHPPRRLRRGRVDMVTGEGAKRIAHVRFDSAGPKKLLIKIAPIAKL